MQKLLSKLSNYDKRIIIKENILKQKAKCYILLNEYHRYLSKNYNQEEIDYGQKQLVCLYLKINSIIC